MYCSDNAERFQLSNLLSVMLHELLFLGYHLHLISHPYSFASYSYSCKILQLYATATARMYSYAILSSTGVPLDNENSYKK